MYVFWTHIRVFRTHIRVFRMWLQKTRIWVWTWVDKTALHCIAWDAAAAARRRARGGQSRLGPAESAKAGTGAKSMQPRKRSKSSTTAAMARSTPGKRYWYSCSRCRR